jgi:hypothetical protein
VKRVVAALVCGAVFGLGLVLARMTDPAVVLGFLDLFGKWDPTLAIVFAGAVATTVLAFPLVMRRRQPLLAARFHVPTSQVIDAPLITGAVIFGIGWGLAGYCPGPALAGLGGAVWTALLFVPAMIAGSLLQRYLFQRRAVA